VNPKSTKIKGAYNALLTFGKENNLTEITPKL
jgi:hypothetical protein